MDSLKSMEKFVVFLKKMFSSFKKKYTSLVFFLNSGFPFKKK